MIEMDRTKKLVVWLDALIAESEQPPPLAIPAKPYVAPKCWRCGTRKMVDLFKGEYCPRCNDWV